MSAISFSSYNGAFRLISLLLIYFLYFPGNAICQEEKTYRKNSVFVEGSLFSAKDVWVGYSINYERQVFQKQNIRINLRTGFGLWGSIGGSGHQYFGGSNFIWGKKNHHLEVQAGGQFLVNTMYKEQVFTPVGWEGGYVSRYLYPYLQLGYRFQKPGGRFLFKLHSGLYGAANMAIGFIL